MDILNNGGKIPVSMKSSVNMLLSRHVDAYNSAMGRLGSGSARKPPAWFHFFGPPGVGKSTLTQRLISELIEAGFFSEYKGPDGKVNPAAISYSRSKPHIGMVMCSSLLLLYRILVLWWTRLQFLR